MEQAQAAPRTPNRWIPVVASVLVQLCLGTSYIWSVFQVGIASYLFDGNNTPAILCFALLLGFLSLGGFLGGKLQARIGPSGVVMAGGAFAGLGLGLCAFIGPQAPWLIWVCYGLMGGLGMGATYSITIAACQKWFPDKRGLVTGLIVSSLGFGGVVFTPIAEVLIKKLAAVDAAGAVIAGTGELRTLGTLGVIFIFVSVAGGFFVKAPADGYRPAGWTPPAAAAGGASHDFTTKQALRTPQLYMTIVTFMLASMAGLMMIGFAKPIAQTDAVLSGFAAVAVMVVSIFNSLGRLFWGWLSDRLGRKNTLLVLMVLTGGPILLVNVSHGWLLLALIAVIGFSYGGYLGVFPTLAAEYWGPKHMSTNYAIVMVGFGLGAISSTYIAAHFKNIAAVTQTVDGVAKTVTDMGKMYPAFIISAVAALVAIVLMALLKPPAKPAEQAGKTA